VSGGGLWKLVVAALEADAIRIERRLEDHAALEPGAVARFEAELPLWTVEAWFDERPDGAAVADALAGIPVARPPAIEQVGEQNWVAFVERTLRPVEAGRFVIHGPHDRVRVAGHPFAIEIEAGEAFGTAHHATTQGCLAAIDRLVPALAPASVLDLGTGSGVLAIAIARLAPDARILASDIDPRAVEIAAENAAKNGVARGIEAICAAGLGHPRIAGRAPFDLIVANILAAPLIELAPRIVAALRPGGGLILSGLLATQAGEVATTYVAAGAHLREKLIIGEWATLELRR
jgi:ribosomal protein L11 methyltransferase